MKITISVEGGAIVRVDADAAVEVLVVDYDMKGDGVADSAEGVYEVPQLDGRTELATIFPALVDIHPAAVATVFNLVAQNDIGDL